VPGIGQRLHDTIYAFDPAVPFIKMESWSPEALFNNLGIASALLTSTLQLLHQLDLTEMSHEKVGPHVVLAELIKPSA